MKAKIILYRALSIFDDVQANREGREKDSFSIRFQSVDKKLVEDYLKRHQEFDPSPNVFWKEYKLDSIVVEADLYQEEDS